MSQCVAAREARVLDASHIVGPDGLADILRFLGVDEDAQSAGSGYASSDSSHFELAHEPGGK